MKEENKLASWALFIGLSLIWGSSFILMKLGLNTLTAYQVASIRILSAGILLLPAAVKKIGSMAMARIPVILLSGLLGSFFPAFLFCIAETRIDSALTGILNALTPVFTVIFGVLFFATPVSLRKISGVLIGFAGLCLLFAGKGNLDLSYFSFAMLVVLATLCYGLNTNVVNKYLREVQSLDIASFAFGMLIVPCILILYFSGFFSLQLSEKPVLVSIAASCILGAVGTAVASVMYYLLIKKSGTIFTSMVTYAIPVIAIAWGSLYDEKIEMWELLCLAVILAGVTLTSKKETAAKLP